MSRGSVRVAAADLAPASPAAAASMALAGSPPAGRRDEQVACMLIQAQRPG